MPQLKSTVPFRRVCIGLAVLGVLELWAWNELAVEEDPHLFMPGSQPSDGVVLESMNQCLNCHAGYDAAVEPGHTWQGSMMAQAGRDPLWLASLTVALQDSIWLLGNANAGDLCIRCHSPVGWLGGRSDPPNTALLDQGLGDFEGVNCSSCHQMIDPIAAQGQEPWLPAETEPESIAAADTTYARDTTVLGSFVLFDNTGFINPTTDLPAYYIDGQLPNYIEASSGQFFMDPDTKVKRGNRHDVAPKSHDVHYSRFHKTHMQCMTCHDVSNAAMANVVLGNGTSSAQAASSYFHIERTSSEFLLSAYGRAGGASTRGALFDSGVTHARSCQDCHMATASGKACNKNVTVRDDLRVHDLSGGNAWMAAILASVDQDADNPAHDRFNYELLSGSRYPGALIDVAGLQGQGPALSDGAERAKANLQRAANLVPLFDSESSASLRIYNNTGHKLISGFPEGRRMWLSVEFYDAAGNELGELNPYTELLVSRDADGVPTYVSGGTLRKDRDDLIFEAKMQSSLTGEDASFHMVLATDRYKDNRIPPLGFDASSATQRLAQARAAGVDAPDYFTAAEYAGGYHDVVFDKPVGTATWTAELYYQTTSYEYIRFLREEINGSASTLSSPTPSGEAQAYIAQLDPYFSGLKDWGEVIWELWLHNDGAEPIEMAETISPPKVLQLLSESSGFEVRFVGQHGRTYTLEVCDDLSTQQWTLIAGPVEGDGSEMSFTDSDSSIHSKRFYRLMNTQAE